MSAPVAVALPTIAFGTSGDLGELTDFVITGATRGFEETTKYGTALPAQPASGGDPTLQIGGRTYIPDGITDPGTFSGTINLHADKQIPLGADAETITITHQPTGEDTTGATEVFKGFFLTVGDSYPLGKKMVRNFTGKISGIRVITPGS